MTYELAYLSSCCTSCSFWYSLLHLESQEKPGRNSQKVSILAHLPNTVTLEGLFENLYLGNHAPAGSARSASHTSVQLGPLRCFRSRLRATAANTRPRPLPTA